MMPCRKGKGGMEGGREEIDTHVCYCTHVYFELNACTISIRLPRVIHASPCILALPPHAFFHSSIQSDHTRYILVTSICHRDYPTPLFDSCDVLLPCDL